MKPQGRQSDKAQNRARANTAFQPIHGIRPKVRPDIWHPDKDKGRGPAGPCRYGLERGGIGFLKNLGINLGDDPGIGNCDRQYAGQR